VELHFWRKFRWFDLSLGHSSCLRFSFWFCWNSYMLVLSKEIAVFRISGNDVFFSFSLFCFFTIFFSVLLQIWREINLWPKPRQDTALHPHTYKRPHIAHPLTPWHTTFPSHPTTPYLLISAPTSRTLHHTLTPSMNLVKLCSPTIPLRAAGKAHA